MIDLRLDSSASIAIRDSATVTSAGVSLATSIAGVVTASPVNHVDHRGRLFEIYPGQGTSELWRDPVVYAYGCTIRPQQTKGWGLHLEKDDRYTLVSGEDLVVLFDARVDSVTHGVIQTVVLSPSGVRQVLIPRGVWHFNIALGNEEAQLVNCPTAVYKHSAPDRLMLSWDSPAIPVDLQKYFPNQLKAPRPTEDC